IFLHPAKHTDVEPNSSGLAYNRKGEPLFAPFLFDNGPDYLSEGMMRFVKGGKVGFVNRIGEIIIHAEYDFVSNFNYGMASYCNGCKLKSEGEHAYFAGGNWGYINTKGEDLLPNFQAKSIKDQPVSYYQHSDSNKYLPYQFQYTLFEQKIIDSFSK